MGITADPPSLSGAASCEADRSSLKLDQAKIRRGWAPPGVNPVANDSLTCATIALLIGREVKISVPFHMPTDRIRFSQASAHSVMKDGNTVYELASDIKNGLSLKRIPPILLYIDDKGRVFTKDNRRLAAALLAGSGYINAQVMSSKRVASDALRHLTTLTEGAQLSILDKYGKIETVVRAGFVDQDSVSPKQG